MGINDLVIEYSGGGILGSRKIELYGDGRVKINLTNGAKSIERPIALSPRQVDSYAKRLVESGFFELDDRYEEMVLDGFSESMTLNYDGRTKKVECINKLPQCSEYMNIRKELTDIIISHILDKW